MTETKIAMTIEEASEYTGIGRNTMRNLVEWGKLRSHDIPTRATDKQYLHCSHSMEFVVQC